MNSTTANKKHVYFRVNFPFLIKIHSNIIECFRTSLLTKRSNLNFQMFCLRMYVQSVGTLPVHPGPGAVRPGSGVQPEAFRAEGAAAAAAPHTAPGAVLQREVPEKRAHQAGTQQTHTHRHTVDATAAGLASGSG